MNRFSIILLSYILIIAFITSCGKKKESTMVDMDTIKTDGSHDDKYIFKDVLEKEEKRKKKYKKNTF